MPVPGHQEPCAGAGNRTQPHPCSGGAAASTSSASASSPRSISAHASAAVAPSSGPLRPVPARHRERSSCVVLDLRDRARHQVDQGAPAQPDPQAHERAAGLAASSPRPMPRAALPPGSPDERESDTGHVHRPPRTRVGGRRSPRPPAPARASSNGAAAAPSQTASTSASTPGACAEPSTAPLRDTVSARSRATSSSPPLPLRARIIARMRRENQGDELGTESPWASERARQ